MDGWDGVGWCFPHITVRPFTITSHLSHSFLLVVSPSRLDCHHMTKRNPSVITDTTLTNGFCDTGISKRYTCLNETEVKSLVSLRAV